MLLGQVPSYNAYMEERGYGHAVRYEQRFLKLLQWRNPRQRWVLKSPDYLRYLPDILEVFPDVRLVWTHRDPVRALGSMVNTMGTLFWMRTDNVRMAGALDHLTDPQVSAAALTAPIRWLEDGTLPREQLCNILYEDLVADPLGTIQRLYCHFGLTLTAAAHTAIGDYLEKNPRSARPRHRYDISAGDGPERRAYTRYQAYFGVPSEA